MGLMAILQTQESLDSTRTGQAAQLTLLHPQVMAERLRPLTSLSTAPTSVAATVVTVATAAMQLTPLVATVATVATRRHLLTLKTGQEAVMAELPMPMGETAVMAATVATVATFNSSGARRARHSCPMLVLAVQAVLAEQRHRPQPVVVEAAALARTVELLAKMETQGLPRQTAAAQDSLEQTARRVAFYK